MYDFRDSLPIILAVIIVGLVIVSPSLAYNISDRLQMVLSLNLTLPN